MPPPCDLCHQLYELKLLSNWDFCFFTTQKSSPFHCLKCSLLSILATTGHDHLGHSYSTGHSAPRPIFLLRSPAQSPDWHLTTPFPGFGYGVAPHCPQEKGWHERMYQKVFMPHQAFSQDLITDYSSLTLCLETCWLVLPCTCVLGHIWLFATPWTVALQALLSMWLSRPEYWCGLPFLLQGNLPDPRIEPESPASPALAGGFLTTGHLEALFSCTLHASSWLRALAQAFLGPSRLDLTPVYQSANAAIMKYHSLVVHRYICSHNSGGQKSPEFSRALEGKNQGAAGLVSTEVSLLDSVMLSSSCIFLRVCLCPNFLFVQGQSHIGLGVCHNDPIRLTLRIMFWLDHFSKRLCLQCSHILRPWGLGFSIRIWGDVIQPKTMW